GPWTLTAPNVSMADGALLVTSDYFGMGGTGASLTIHTTNLSLGDGANGFNAAIDAQGITIDNLGVSSFGPIDLAIVAYGGLTETMNARGQSLSVNATANSNSTLTIESTSSSQATIVFDSDNGVSMTSPSQITINDFVTLGNAISSSDWTLSAPNIQIGDG